MSRPQSATSGCSPCLMDNATIAIIADEVRAKSFGFSKDGSSPDSSRFTSVKEWDVEGVAMTIGIAKAE